MVAMRTSQPNLVQPRSGSCDKLLMWTRKANRVWRSEVGHITRAFSSESEEAQESSVWGLRLSVSQQNIEKSGHGKSRMKMWLFFFSDMTQKNSRAIGLTIPTASMFHHEDKSKRTSTGRRKSLVHYMRTQFGPLPFDSIDIIKEKKVHDQCSEIHLNWNSSYVVKVFDVCKSQYDS